jgi:hypothetical protein
VAPSRVTIASVCRDDSPTAPSRVPLANPARSISHAAGSFTRPSACGKDGAAVPARTAACSRRPRRDDRIGEERSHAARVRIGSSITIALRRRMSITAARTFATEGLDMPCFANAVATSA